MALDNCKKSGKIYTLDTSGLFCPEPIMMLHQKVRQIEDGECIKLISTDPSSWRDIPKFCEFLKHKLLQKIEKNQLFEYLIQKNV